MKNTLIAAFKKQIAKTTDFNQIEIHEPFNDFFNKSISKAFSSITLNVATDKFIIYQVLIIGATITFGSTTEKISDAEFIELSDLAKSKYNELRCTETNNDYAKLKKILES